MPDNDNNSDPIRLRIITARPDVPFDDDEDDLPISRSPHWFQVESTNDHWMPFAGVFEGETALREALWEVVSPTYQSVRRAGLWALRHPHHPVLQAIAAQMPFVHYLAAGPDVLYHDPEWETITIPGIADDLTIISDTAGRDIDTPTTSSGLIAVSYDHQGEHLSPGRPRITVRHWAVPDEIFDEPLPGEDVPQSEGSPDTAVHVRRIYTVVLEYVATGEGMRFQVLVVPAVDEATARQAFLNRFYPGSPDLQDWYGRGVDVYPGVYRPALTPMLGEHYLAHLERTAEHGEFALDHVFNLG